MRERRETAALLFFCLPIVVWMLYSFFKEVPHEILEAGRMDGAKFNGILYGIPLFILSGFEHSIADMFYFSASDAFVRDTGAAALFLLTVIAGNAVGGVLLPLLQLPGTRAKKGGEAA